MNVLSKVVVSEKDLALINSINIIFPGTSNLLCQFHINKNVKAKCKMLVDSMQDWEVVMDALTFMMDCVYCDEFVGCVKHFEVVCSSWSIFFDYVNDIW